MLPGKYDLIRYGKAVKELDLVLEALTRPLCKRCPYDEDVGCCVRQDVFARGFEENSDFLHIQKEEASEKGYSCNNDYCCRYFIESEGCSLSNYKSPICIGYICTEVESYLRINHGPEDSKEFIRLMFEISNNSHISRQITSEKLVSLENLLKKAADSGKDLLKRKTG